MANSQRLGLGCNCGGGVERCGLNRLDTERCAPVYSGSCRLCKCIFEKLPLGKVGTDEAAKLEDNC